MTTPRIIFKIKKIVKSSSFLVLRKKRKLEMYRIQEKVWKKRRWTKILLHRHQLWFLTPWYIKYKVFRPFKYKKLKKIKTNKKTNELVKVKKFIINHKLKILCKRSTPNMRVMQTTVLSTFNSFFKILSHLNLFLNVHKTNPSYFKVKYKKQHFKRLNSFSLKKSTIYKRIKYFKYHEKQQPLLAIRQANRCIRWVTHVFTRVERY